MSTARSQISAQLDQLDFESLSALNPLETITLANIPKAIAERVEEYEQMTGRVRLLYDDVNNRRREARLWDLDCRASSKAMLEVPSLLDELASDRGLTWSQIAYLCRISMSAIRKWRLGESASPENRRTLARLAAFLDLIEEVGPVDEPAGWLHMRLSQQSTMTGADVYVEGGAQDLLECAQGHLTPMDLLDGQHSDWRDSTRSDWTIIDEPDGERMLIRRERLA